MIAESPVRRLFPSAESSLHLDHAGVSPISTRVDDSCRRFLAESVDCLPRRYPYWELRAEEVRAACARLAGAEPRQVACVKNTSEALSFVAAGFAWREGDVVLTVEEEFPSNVYPWWDLRRRGVECRSVPSRAVMGDLDGFVEALDARVRMVAVSAIAYATGDRRPLAELAQLCRDRDVFLVVDAIQALGAVSLDLGREGLDCVAADGHKWICAPEGTGFMAVSDRLLDRLRPIELGWKSVVASDQFYPYRFHVRSDAAKLEAGSLNLLGIHGLGAAVDLILEVGMPTIERRIGDLTDTFAQRLQRRGRPLLGARGAGRSAVCTGILTFEPAGDPERLRQELWARGIVCKTRMGGLRLSPHHYQDGRDVDAFFQRLDEAERALA